MRSFVAPGGLDSNFLNAERGTEENGGNKGPKFVRKMGSFGNFNRVRISEEDVVCGMIRFIQPARCPFDASPIPIRQDFGVVCSLWLEELLSGKWAEFFLVNESCKK